MVIMDIDGVLTDGAMYYSEGGEELKKFHTRDGHGIQLLHAEGIRTALVTGESTTIVSRRAAKLQIEDVHQGVRDKLCVVKALLERHGISPSEACYIGDDLGDLDVMKFVGVAVAVGDASPEIKRVAHYVTRRHGGEGAVREVCDRILSARSHGGACGQMRNALKRLVRPLVPRRFRMFVLTMLPPRRERYTPEQVERVKSVTTQQWQTIAQRSPKYISGYWDHADHEQLRTRGSRRSEWFAALPFFAGARSVMELGCATGRNLYFLQRRYPDMALCGVDINQEAIEYARSRVRGEFIVGNVYDLGSLLKGKNVDVIFTMGLLIHIHPDLLSDLIREMKQHACRHLVFCEQISESNDVVKGPAWWRPSLKVTGNYLQWSPNLSGILNTLGLSFDLSEVPVNLQVNGARDLVVVPLS